MKIGRIRTYVTGLILAGYLSGCGLHAPTGFGGDTGGPIRPCDIECRKNRNFSASLDAFFKEHGRGVTPKDDIPFVQYTPPCGFCPERATP